MPSFNKLSNDVKAVIEKEYTTNLPSWVPPFMRSLAPEKCFYIGWALWYLMFVLYLGSPLFFIDSLLRFVFFVPLWAILSIVTGTAVFWFLNKKVMLKKSKA